MNFYPALKYRFLTPYYDRVIRLLVPEKRIKLRIAGLLLVEPGNRVLDFGCGTGTLCEIIRKKEPGCFVTGLDPDPKMIQLASEKYTGISFVLSAGNPLPFPPLHFDRIVSSWTFHHLNLATKTEALTEIYRLLKPGGRFILADWTQPRGLWQKTAFWLIRVLDNFETFKEHASDRIPVLLTQAGFKLLDSRELHQTSIGTFRICVAVKCD